jgi:hypothetical protein
MMTFGELLREHKEAIVQRWLEGVLATYPENTSAAFMRQKDPFANPVGHSVRVGTRGIFEALLDGMDAGTIDVEKVRPHLSEIIKIRSVQQFSASQAVCFVFHLKEAIRTELGKAVVDPRHSSALTDVETQIDRIALEAFDIFVQCREQVCDLRVNEAKRRVSWVMEKLNKRDPTQTLGLQENRVGASKGMNARREGLE